MDTEKNCSVRQHTTDKTPVKLNCPLEGCHARNIARLDRHLHRIHDIQTVNPEYAALMSKAKATVDRRSTSNVTDNWMQEQPEERHKSTEKTHTLSSDPGVHQESAPPTLMPSGREPACTKTLPTVTGLRQQLRATEDTSAATGTGSVRPESSTSCSGTYLSPSSASEDDDSSSSSSSSSYTEHGPSSPEPRSQRDPKALQLYRAFLSGPLPTAKGRDNTKQAVQHIRLFLQHMARLPEGPVRNDLRFLRHASRSQSWFDELMRSGLKPTTVHSYLQDVLSFLRYLHEADLSHVKLSERNIRSLMFLLKSFRKQGKRQLSLHRQLVQDHGQERLIPKNKLQCFNQQCETAIPELLDLCESAPSNACTLVGLLCGRLLLHNGHRRGVVMNMSLLDFDGAKAYTGEFHISVSNHKTAATFGKAVLVGNPIKKIGRAISKAWKYWGLGDDITTGMIRSAVVTYTWATHNEVNKTAVSRHMAHSLRTQESFYVHDQAPADHQRARRLIGESLELTDSLPPLVAHSASTEDTCLNAPSQDLSDFNKVL
ncbi:uncharacterized protein LOC131737358 isoform X2 [Acipenser ruthenus]|uniref:uncharacterized protein LOC131704821 isoform X2 n=2 Tax=Acipenser ruthenus TaxID=7906 RepID=UPI00274172A5|nr:uncharacterized protein LOC131704821 isoform X2 [Acipenser ruthenus]XP_058862499.1 uncharacterized protein LOC131704869 isoform X2 [Acipenser ruthenus]XP_058871596.1 uncharacterized protein LOC131722044 isoform X2 [Acipenser ruthenus]XP_058871599.1 uncharacterized protein LOC131696624 isoform X2 [Acipenser ruthenus]XP_058877664.1 uncharacterized protein LOC131696588 isoform X2 [Acipenser ruthenus]XP_058881902.1 uncharacterized protein LOC131737356 isoform X2 [Acipenser ruthenus]XP_05888190